MNNPCKPCLEKYDLKDLNDINNCCYQNCANLLGTTDLNIIAPSECGKKCAECVDKSKLARGKSLCYYNRIQVPVIWNTHETDTGNGCGGNSGGSNDGGDGRYNTLGSLGGSAFIESFEGPYGPYAKEKPIPFYLGLILSGIVLLYILYIIFRVIFGKR